MSFSKDAWLVYNGDKSIKIDRNKVANTCSYFRNLLQGPFKESKQFTIQINLGTAFSYEAFRCVVKYANDGVFYRDPEDCHLYIETIQLAIAWGYDEFVTILEDHLIERGICRDEIDVLTCLARLNMPILKRLLDACDRFADSMARRDFISISRCCIENHKLHAYLDCVGPKQGDLMEHDWDKTVSDTLTEQEKSQLANLREEADRKRQRDRRTRKVLYSRR